MANGGRGAAVQDGLQAGHSSRAATWRDHRGQDVETTDASTMCWRPRVYGHLRAVGEDGFQTILPCGKCPGCREFQRRTLAKRLQKHFQNHDGDLFTFTIKVPLEEQTRFESNLRRRRGVQLESAFIRHGPGHIIIIARSLEPLESILKKSGHAYTCEKIRKPGRRKPWGKVAAGLLVAREKYGKNTNRFYIRGLAPREKRTWKIERPGRQSKFDWRSSPRAWRADGAKLLPPAAWQNFGRGDRSKVIAKQDAALTPEQAEQVREMVATTSQARQLPLTAAASAAPALTPEERQQRWEEQEERRALERQRRFEERQQRRKLEEEQYQVEKAQREELEKQRQERQIAHLRRMAQAEQIAQANSRPTGPSKEPGTVTELLDNKDPPKRQIRSDEELQRAGPDEKQEWLKRDLEEQARRREANGEARAWVSSAPRLWTAKVKAVTEDEVMGTFQRMLEREKARKRGEEK